MDLHSCITKLQTYLSNAPLVVLGSGASASFGLPTMYDLAEEICKHRSEFSVDKVTDDFFENIKNGIDLETSLDLNAQMQSSDKNLIRKIVWKFVNAADIVFFNNLMQNKFEQFSLSCLLKKLLLPTPHVVDIVTTNYDRLAEYASDQVEANTVTGYEGVYYRKMEIPSAQVILNRIKARMRTVNIWKVHGSLDWFISPNGDLVAFPIQNDIPDLYIPNIVPPGHDKYEITHFDPYRNIMAQADKAIEKAKCFLIIGYGFNDSHIQPRILEEIKKNKPIVVVTKKATPECKRLIQQTPNIKFMIIEECEGKTKVTTESGDGIYAETFWTLEGLINIW